MRTFGLLALVLVVAAALGGCQLFENRTATADDRLMAQQRPVIPDLPVPAGFKMDLKHTFYNSASGMRTGYVTYDGRADGPRLMEFFKDNMPISGWALVRESTDPNTGSFILQFEKEGEGAGVKITPGHFSSEFVVTFTPGTTAR